MGHIFLLGSPETEPKSVLEVDAVISWGKEAEGGMGHQASWEQLEVLGSAGL